MFIVEFIDACVDCNTGRGMPPSAGQSPGNVVPSRPFQIVAMDFAIPLPATHQGNQAFLLFTCLFSGFVILVPMNSTTAEEVASVYLDNVFRRYGAQESVRHDRDPRFMSSVFKKLNRMMKQRQRPTLASSPQANGKQERSVQTAMRAVKMYVEDSQQADWKEYVPRLEFALNSSISLQYGYSAFYLVHGWEARAQLEAMLPAVDGSIKEFEAQKCRKSVQLVRERADKHNTQVKDQTARNAKVKYKEGEWVWLYYSLVKPGLSKKLHLDGRDSCFYPAVHVSRLKPFTNKVARPIDRVEVEELVDFDDELLPEDSWESDNASGEYEVEGILDDKAERMTRGGRMQRKFLIK
ncbi:TPA: LOW QUALITY PROTEIN: hypothetical protein N0F65_004135 [Lagenidium giganteum]|uniref:Integrase catalytic domain-containing protein n=1 Tax=Lagenidium giganteum TaxID=4803 RepID=A0AAV2Z8H3_9STRA|nr:TPA: LOW QUALITY PROTEIN: hypothetical protein N0F65_004135 [Lagenidium giganteum]